MDVTGEVRACDTRAPADASDDENGEREFLKSAIRGESCVRGPAWRWLCADTKASLGCGLAADHSLQQVRQYRALLAAGRAEAAQAEAVFPTLARAVRLERCPETTFRLRLLWLAGVTIEEIADRNGSDPATIDMWQRVFFDVAEGRSARDWIEIHVCAPERAAGRGDLALQYQLAAAGGPLVAHRLLDAGPPANEADRIRRRRERLELMSERALTMVLHDRRDAMRFIEFTQQVRCDERRLELAEQRLAHRMLEDARGHERALYVARLRQESIDRRRLAANSRHGSWPPGREPLHGQPGMRPDDPAGCPGAPASDAAPRPAAPINAASVVVAPVGTVPPSAASDGMAEPAADAADGRGASEAIIVATCMAALLAPPVIDDDRAATPTPTTPEPLTAAQGGAS